MAQATREARDEASRPDLEVDGLVKRFGSILAVDRVSFSLAPGEFYSLLGPSGCGKTTTLRLVAGFELPEAGTIRIRGSDVTRRPAHHRNVNTVFQHYALFPHLSVEDNVEYGLRQQRLPREEMRRRLEDALDVVRLRELRDRYPRQLSGGAAAAGGACPSSGERARRPAAGRAARRPRPETTKGDAGGAEEVAGAGGGDVPVCDP